MAQQSARRGWKNQRMAERIKARKADLDPVRELPYRPAAKTLLTEAGQMAASDYALTSIYRLRFKGRPQMPSGLNVKDDSPLA